MLKGALTVGGWTMASRIAGFARDMLIAALAGAGPIADAFFVANRLPNLFRRLFGEGAFNAAFVPEFAGLLTVEGPEAAREFAEDAFSVLGFWLVFLTLLGEIFMPFVMHGIAPGFAADPAKFALAVELSRITFPYLPLICLAALLSGVLNGMDRFAAAAAAPVLYNVFSIGAMFLLRPYVPTVGHALAWGVSVSGIAQLWLLMVAARRAGMKLHPRIPRWTRQIRVLMRRMAPGLIGGSVNQLNLAIDTIIASLLPAGSVSLLYYADRVNQLPLGVIGTAVGTALLPTLSRQVLAKDLGPAHETQNRALEYALFLTIPAAMALIVAKTPIMFVLFARGAFTAADAEGSGMALAAYALGLPAFVAVKVLLPGFYARGDTSTPVKLGMVALVLNLVLNLSLIWSLQHVGIALATSLAAIFNCGSLGWVLHRRGHLRLDAQLKRRLPRMALAALAMAVACVALQHTVFAALAPGHWLRWLGLAILVGGGMAAYLGVAELLGACNLRDMAGTLLRRRRRAALS
jgi:putative peptidoglycan lipid II flippase